jgi:predicted O-methyltransferase YrrM
MIPSKLKAFGRDLRAPLHRWAARRRLAEFHSRPRGVAEMVDLALRFHGKGHYRLRTMQVESEITALVEAVAAIRPRVILEIGTSAFGTAFLWAQLASERVLTCDLRGREGLAQLCSAFPPLSSRCRVDLLIGDSHDPAFRHRVTDSLAGAPVDFLFIDGDHSSQGVEADWRDYSPLVRKGGLIAFHDIVEHQPVPGNQVQQFWKKVRGQPSAREFIADPFQCGYGIGVLEADGER